MASEYLPERTSHLQQINIYVSWDVRQRILIGGFAHVSDKYIGCIFRTKEGIVFLRTADSQQPA